jgi:hypothetical protein
MGGNPLKLSPRTLKKTIILPYSSIQNFSTSTQVGYAKVEVSIPV